MKMKDENTGMLASGSGDLTIKLWDVERSECLSTIDFGQFKQFTNEDLDPSPIYSICVSPKIKEKNNHFVLVCGDLHGNVRIIEIAKQNLKEF